MPVIGMLAARGDFLLRRDSINRVGVRWRRDRRDGRGAQPMDLSGWTARLIMSFAGEDVYSLDCLCTDTGIAAALIPDGAFDDAAWETRQSGSWRIEATGPDDEGTRRIGEGLWHMS